MAEPGWYRDRSGNPYERWWTGADWSPDHTRPLTAPEVQRGTSGRTIGRMLSMLGLFGAISL